MKKIYFASDFHLGADGKLSSRERERQIIRWFDQVADDAEAIYLVGDMFDFWYEYRTVVPKGYVRILGKLAELQDAGIALHQFTGNHDLWMFGYLEDEIGLKVYKQPVHRSFHGKKFIIGHGDGLGPGDKGYKFLKKIFTNRSLQWLFSRVHPNAAFRLAQYLSDQSRMKNEREVFQGADNEWLLQYAEAYLQEEEHIDYFVFGHRHLTIDYRLRNGSSRYVNLGEWLHTCSYAFFDGQELYVSFFENDDPVLYTNHALHKPD